MKYQDEKFYRTYQHGVRWPNNYIGLDPMTHWIIEKSDGFTVLGCIGYQEAFELMHT